MKKDIFSITPLSYLLADSFAFICSAFETFAPEIPTAELVSVLKKGKLDNYNGASQRSLLRHIKIFDIRPSKKLTRLIFEEKMSSFQAVIDMKPVDQTGNLQTVVSKSGRMETTTICITRCHQT